MQHNQGFKVLVDNGRIRQMNLVKNLSDLMAPFQMMEVGIRSPDGMRHGRHSTRFSVRTMAGHPLPENVEAAIDRAIVQGYVDLDDAF
ncbi:hypothetical protein LAZ40_03165 [Cereibacter sphaeroides]|uniref:hypothetical protein n=1 Tax=Cereibacter sphaeroides TaxID=1063 RepID=UPI001F433C13|nr:hypothetical protein [Cereibacter sphaeroides]MCE6958055.1 hypothetical protein [Cereibacter sphaeroides]MCE6971352.1 hypothetical protein [Cereibacter sphaeroides]